MHYLLVCGAALVLSIVHFIAVEPAGLAGHPTIVVTGLVGVVVAGLLCSSSRGAAPGRRRL